MLKFIKNYKFEVILWFFILVYIIFFSYLSIRRVYTFNSYYYDLGIMHQVVYNTSHGRFLEMTNQDFGKNISRLAIHFDPILALLAPFYKIYEGPETLLVIQTIIIGIGAWVVYLIVQELIKNKQSSLLFAISYLLFFPVERANLFDFHPVVLATTFILLVIYFLLKKKYGLMFVFAFLSLLTKEHVGLILALFSLYIFFIKKERRYSIILFIISLLFFVTTVNWVIPYFRQESHFALKYFGDFGDSPKNVFIGLIKNPSKLFSLLLSKDTLYYYGKLLLSYGIFVIFSPIEFLISLPELLINGLSTSPNMRKIYFHYNSLIVPFIVWSAILGYKRIRDSKFLRNFLLIFICVVAFLSVKSIYLYNPLPLSFLKEPYWWGKIDQNKISLIKQWHENLDKNQVVATTPKLAPFFSGRTYYYNFLYDSALTELGYSDNDIIKYIKNYQMADYVVIDRSEINGKFPKLFYKSLKDNVHYKLIEDKEEIEIYKKENSKF